MRLYPAGGVASFRRIHTGKDLVLGGGKLVVPAGVALHFPITAVHHSRAVWEDPEAFSPERFLEVRPAMRPWMQPAVLGAQPLCWERAQAAVQVTQLARGWPTHRKHAKKSRCQHT